MLAFLFFCLFVLLTIVDSSLVEKRRSRRLNMFMVALTLNANHVSDDDAQIFHFFHTRGQLALILLLHLPELLLQHFVFVLKVSTVFLLVVQLFFRDLCAGLEALCFHDSFVLVNFEELSLGLSVA